MVLMVVHVRVTVQEVRVHGVIAVTQNAMETTTVILHANRVSPAIGRVSLNTGVVTEVP